MLTIFLRFTQPFRDLDLSMNFFMAKAKIVGNKTLNKQQVIIKRSTTRCFKLHWCLLRSCCDYGRPVTRKKRKHDDENMSDQLNFSDTYSFY